MIGTGIIVLEYNIPCVFNLLIYRFWLQILNERCYGWFIDEVTARQIKEIFSMEMS